jgi:hypothetical protein
MRSFFSGEPLNPMHYMWPHLLELGCPFIKKDLVRGKVIRDLGSEIYKHHVQDMFLPLLDYTLNGITEPFSSTRLICNWSNILTFYDNPICSMLLF